MFEDPRPASKAGYSRTQEPPEWFGQLPGYPGYALLNQGNTTAGRRNHGITRSIFPVRTHHILVRDWCCPPGPIRRLGQPLLRALIYVNPRHSRRKGNAAVFNIVAGSSLLLKDYGLIAFSVEKVRCERVIPPHIFRLNFSKTAGSRIRLTSVGMPLRRGLHPTVLKHPACSQAISPQMHIPTGQRAFSEMAINWSISPELAPCVGLHKTRSDKGNLSVVNRAESCTPAGDQHSWLRTLVGLYQSMCSDSRHTRSRRGHMAFKVRMTPFLKVAITRFL